MAVEILDSCCIINTYAASDNYCSFLRGMGGDFFIPRVVIEETLYVRKPDEEDETKLEQINLSIAVDAGLLQFCDLRNPEENTLFIQFATELGDGEAACLAIAQAREWTVATDDRKAHRLAKESEIAIVTTPELMKRWADVGNVSDAEIGTALRRIRKFACFAPRSDSIYYEWWMRLSEA